MYFWTVGKDGTRNNFTDLQIKEANLSAQVIANTTGHVAYRHDSNGGKSMMIPGYEYNPHKAKWVAIKGYKAPCAL